MSLPHTRAIGIDLGTTFSRVATWHGEDVVLIPNERGEFSTPSVLAFTDDQVLFGDAAAEHACHNMENTIFAPQRLIGMKMENPWVQWHIKTCAPRLVPGDGGSSDSPVFLVWERGRERSVRPEELLTMFLSHLRKLAEKHLGASVVDAVVTVPSRYGKRQREAMLEACRGARLNVLDLVKAPTAAGIALSLTKPFSGNRNLVVCDMGGSYFDTSLLRIEEGVITEKATETDYVDLNNALVKFCIQDLKEKFATKSDHPLVRLRLRRGCDTAKRQLSQHTHTRLEVRHINEGLDYVCYLSREQLELLWREDVPPLLEPIGWCLEEAGWERPDVDDIVLVGGSAYIPAIQRALRDFFHGKILYEVVKPQHAAVLGAAAYVASLVGAEGGDVHSVLKRIELHQTVPWWTVAPDEGELVCKPIANFEDSEVGDIAFDGRAGLDSLVHSHDGETLKG